MSDIAHNWDIEEMERLKGEIQKLRDVLSENKDLLVSEGFELLHNWQGKAGQTLLTVTASDAGTLEKLTKNFEQLIEKLDSIITKCYEPCEQEIKQKVSQLLF